MFFSGKTNVFVGICKSGLLKHLAKTNFVFKYTVNISNHMAEPAVSFF